jgi:hypothetical protein
MPVDPVGAVVCANDIGVDHGDGKVAGEGSVEGRDGDYGLGSDSVFLKGLSGRGVCAREGEGEDSAGSKGGYEGGDDEGLGEVCLDSLDVELGCSIGKGGEGERNECKGDHRGRGQS